MKFFIREESLAWGDDFQIWDADGKLAYVVDGDGITIFNRINFHLPDKKLVATVNETLLSFGREYMVSAENEPLAKVMAQRASYGTVQFSIEISGKPDAVAIGDFYNHEYTIQRGEKVLARVTNEAEGEGFSVDVLVPEKKVLLLSCVVVIEVISRDNGQAGPMYK